jgi:hypothetical protein
MNVPLVPTRVSLFSLHFFDIFIINIINSDLDLILVTIALNVNSSKESLIVIVLSGIL